jgi:hypothetical protein
MTSKSFLGGLMLGASLFCLLLQPVSARGRGRAVTPTRAPTAARRPAYSIEFRGVGNAPYTEKVYVAAGKTVRLNPNQPIQP